MLNQSIFHINGTCWMKTEFSFPSFFFCLVLFFAFLGAKYFSSRSKSLIINLCDRVHDVFLTENTWLEKYINGCLTKKNVIG